MLTYYTLAEGKRYNNYMGKSLSIRLKDKATEPAHAVVHDFRLYSRSLPRYIDPGRSFLNRVLVRREDIPAREEEAEKWIKEIENESKATFRKLREGGLIPQNQGYRIKRPIVQGILTLSHEAQMELKDDKKMDRFLELAREYLQNLAKALGTDLLYAVLHMDETAPHIHFALRNLRYKEPDPESAERLGWEDLWETLKKGLGKAISNTFYSEDSVRAKRKADFMLSYSQLQDSLDFFKPSLGFGRGTPKKEREARGEPWWKIINRSVRQLHEDLPKEIKLLKRELEEKKEKLRRAEERLKELERGRNRQRETLEEKIKHLEETLDKELDEKLRLIEELERLRKENRELREELRRVKGDEPTQTHRPDNVHGRKFRRGL